MRRSTEVALDGPLNGFYISAAEAEAHGYVLVEWTDDEWAYLHVETAAPLEADEED